jgi:FkbM family methyltransferase
MRPIAYCGDHIALTFTHFGDRIYVDTRDTSLAPHIMLEGMWEEWVTRCFVQTLSENQGCTFIDVGANFGWYTLLAARLGARHVYAFEPQTHLCELLTRSLKVNGYGGRVHVLPFGCSDQNDVMIFAVRRDELGGGHVLENSELLSARSDTEVETFSTPMLTLDHELSALISGPPLVIKLDVEGHEPQVLAGASKLLEHRPLLFIEHHRTVDAANMLRMLEGRGYTIQHVRHSGHLSPALSIEQAMELEDAETLFCEVP